MAAVKKKTAPKKAASKSTGTSKKKTAAKASSKAPKTTQAKAAKVASKKPEAVKTAAPVNQVIEQMTKSMESAIAGVPLNNYFTSMEEMMSKSPYQFDTMAQDISQMGQAQMEAAVKSSTVFFKGMEDIMKTCMGLCQEQAEKATEATKELMACKTLNELTEAQTKVAQKSFDDFMSGATKLSELSVKVCTEACEPLNSQLGKTIKQASDKMAA